MDNIEREAKRLVERFLNLPKNEDAIPEVFFGDHYDDAKEYAIICVEEIIASYKSKSPNYEKETYWHPIDYLQQVKEKIQSL